MHLIFLPKRIPLTRKFRGNVLKCKFLYAIINSTITIISIPPVEYSMSKFKNFTLTQYLDVLSERTPVPGGGSAAALTAALGAALISMVANYSLGRGKPRDIETNLRKALKRSEAARRRLLQLVDLDAQAYLKVVRARTKSARHKQAALKAARKVPLETCYLCYRTVELAPYLVKHGNRYLLSDVQVAVEFLLAAFRSAKVNVEVNQ